MSKKNVALIAGLVFIAVIVLLGVFLFRIQTVTVDFDSESALKVDAAESEKIIAASGIIKGKSIFSLSESKMVRNIENEIHDVKVVNIERRFPNKVVIHVSKRVPVYALGYRLSQSASEGYVLVDGDMTVLGILDEKPEDGKFVTVEGFSLVGRYAIESGKTLPVEFGDQIFYLQNVAAGFYNCGLTPAQFLAFISKVVFESNVTDVKTRSGVTLRIGSGLTTEDILERIPLAYEWYMSTEEGSPERTGGFARYYADSKSFRWESV